MISIITPVRNNARFLRQAIESVLSQDYSHVEHVIVDGVSTDGTLEILREFAALEPDRVRFISEPDRGACDAWNKGWKLARGKIFGWLGADDFYEPGALRRIVEYFSEHQQAHFVYGECAIVDEDGRVSGRYATTDYDRQVYVDAANGIAAMAAFYTRTLVENVGGLDTTINLCDCDYWIRAAERYRLHRIPDLLANFRYHDSSVTRNLQGNVYLREQFILNRRYGGSLASPVCRRFLKHEIEKIPGVNRLLAAFKRDAEVLGAAVSSADSSGSDLSGHAKSRDYKRIAIYGAALSGRGCFEEMTLRNCEVVFFIDNAPPPGAVFMDKPVRKPSEAGWDEIDAVFIASSGRADEMQDELKRRGVRKPVHKWHAKSKS